MNTCETCKYWKREEDEYHSAYSLGLGRCKSALELWNCMEWNEEGDKNVFTTEGENLNKFVKDGSDYLAKLLTKPNFGCTDWEAE